MQPWVLLNARLIKNVTFRYIYIVKRKLFMILRSELSEDWPKYIKLVVEGLNNTPLKKLGYLKPIEILNEKTSVDVQVNKKIHNIPTYRQPDFESQVKNVEEYKGELQIGDYCYKFYDEKLFDKKYNISVS